MKNLLIAFVIFCHAANAQFISMVTPAARLSARESQQLNGLIRTSRVIHLDAAKISSHVRQNLNGARLQLPVNDDLILDINIQPTEIRTAAYQAEITTDQGIQTDTSMKVCNTFSGFANGNPNEFVRLYIDNNQIKGVVSDGKDGFYAIEPLSDLTKGELDNRYVIFKTSDVKSGDASCGTAEPITEAINKAQASARTHTTVSTSCRILEVATDADYEYYLNNKAKTNARILNDMNIVAGIFLNSFNIRIMVTYQHVYATKNDPYTFSNPYKLLNEEVKFWNENRKDIKRDLVHLFTGRILDELILGIGKTGTVGKSPELAYSLTFNMPEEYMTVAHEIGHNFGASHPKDAASGCSATSQSIMCSGLKNGLYFSDFSKGEINAFLNEHDDALLVSDYNFEILGDSSVCSKTIFRANLLGPSVEWSSSNVSLMTINPSTGEAKRIGTETGYVTITAVVDVCSTPITLTKQVFVGLPSISLAGDVNGNGAVGMSLTEVPYAKYNWYLDGKLMQSGIDNITEIDGGDCGGNHFVQASVTNACGTSPMSNKISYNWKCTDAGVNVYPNPARDVVSLDYDGNTNKEIFAKQIILYNENSAIVRSVSHDGVNGAGKKTDLNVADLPRGTYFLYVVPSEGSRQKSGMKRIVLQ